MSATYTSRFPEIASRGSLGTQKAVTHAGQEIEFHALSSAQMRQLSGAEVRKLRWKANRNPYSGWVRAGTFYTRFSEYGTRHQPARPILGPAADRAEPHFIASVTVAWRRA